MYEIFVYYLNLLKLGVSSKRRKPKSLLDKRKQREVLGKRQKPVFRRSRKRKAGTYVLLKRYLALCLHSYVFVNHILFTKRLLEPTSLYQEFIILCVEEGIQLPI